MDNNFLQSVFSLIPSDTSEESLDQKGTSNHKRKQKRRDSFNDEVDEVKRKKKRSDDRATDGDKMIHEGGPNSESECDASGQGNSLHDKIQQKIKECKGKRNKRTREEVLAKRRERKSKKKKSFKKNRLSANKGTDLVGRVGDTDQMIKPTEKRKPTFNKEGKLVFSKFDFSDDKQKKKRSVSGLVGRDYKKILQTLEKRKEKIENMKSEDAEAAYELSKRDAYNVAISKAQGVKVRDDAALVTKAIKRKEQREKKSKTLWKQREDTVNKNKKERQDKRTSNINARRQQKIDGKIKRGKKKSRVAGF